MGTFSLQVNYDLIRTGVERVRYILGASSITEEALSNIKSGATSTSVAVTTAVLARRALEASTRENLPYSQARISENT